MIIYGWGKQTRRDRGLTDLPADAHGRKVLRAGITRASFAMAAALLAACSSGATPAAPPSPLAFVTTPPPATPPPTVDAIATQRAARTPSPTPAGFTLRTQTGQPPGGFFAFVSGLNPNESFLFVAGGPGQPGTPRSQVADGSGGFRLGFDQVRPGGSCLLARRSNGAIARADVGVSAGSTCPADLVYLYLSGPATVRPTQFTDFTSNAPAGEIVEFLSLVGLDGPRTPDWSTQRVGPPPVAILFRFSPEYDRQRPLPAGPYTISYRLMGQRYDFTLTLAP